MSHLPVVAPDAESDLQEAFVWYEKRSQGLGHEFLQSVDIKIKEIVRAPLLFRKRFGSYRLAATARFPYAIWFIFDETAGTIAIRRVLHFRQDTRFRLQEPGEQIALLMD
jgi:plasmid stabilization system protein ParE